MLNFLIHYVSTMFACLCVVLCSIGIVATWVTGEYLKCAWGVAALGLSIWLSLQLVEKSKELFDKLFP